MSERKRFRGSGIPVSEADWKPGTARTPVSLSYGAEEAESYGVVYKERGSCQINSDYYLLE